MGSGAVAYWDAAIRLQAELRRMDQENRTLEDRVNGEAEARSHLSGQFHEALDTIIEFSQEAHTAITITEANVRALTDRVERIEQILVKSAEVDDQRFQALRAAIQGVWAVTQPRPSIWSQIFGR